MKIIFVLLASINFSAFAASRCVVEMFNSNGDPVGHMFQDRLCSTAMTQCRNLLQRLNLPRARCEVTLDLPYGSPADSCVLSALRSVS
jgi:hypothetical protein